MMVFPLAFQLNGVLLSSSLLSYASILDVYSVRYRRCLQMVYLAEELKPNWILIKVIQTTLTVFV